MPTLASIEDLAHVSDRPGDEPALCSDNIQGNGLAGFNKDHQTLIFIRIDEPEAFKKWLAAQIPFVATVAEVLAFNRLFKSVRFRRKHETRTVQATWTNIAFTHAALAKLLAQPDLGFHDAAFKAGLADRSAGIGDAQDAGAEGTAANWLFGTRSDEPVAVVIVAGDDVAATADEVRRIEDSLFSSHPHAAGEPFRAGATVVFKQHGATLPPPLTGHEHFGWLDGVSQPGVRGTVSDATITGPGGAVHLDLLTLRQNPHDKAQGKPGQDALYPGEFVFGHPKQAGTGDIAAPGPIAQAGPDWSDDGSFLVIRRLRQDVRGFHEWLKQYADDLRVEPELLGSLLVGRWPSGSPLMFEPSADHPEIGRSDDQNNWFEFHGQPPHDPTKPTDPSQSKVIGVTPPLGDPTGLRCPVGAHIRKAYPRDDQPAGGAGDPQEVTTQTHRLLRRGIPFGPAFDPTATDDDGNRGLVFAAYMTSIENQFEFVTKTWLNNVNFKDPGVGLDPIIGLGAPGTNPGLQVRINFPDGKHVDEHLDVPASFVTPTGGGYFFAPSIRAMQTWCGLPLEDRCRVVHQPQGGVTQPQNPIYRAPGQ
ncbi:MAG: Dyp-type peroxidase [Candidatus Eremiobacteraeota bacterium]|nr:Dyp-type peroxidase [Candidatus Eremiobacteraeota bacterium]